MSFTVSLALALAATSTATPPDLSEPIAVADVMPEAADIPPPPPAPPPPPGLPAAAACNAPVLMVITGPTRDAVRMRAYGLAIAESRLYEQLGGYYLNIPAAIDSFEGEAEEGFTTLIVRFPCLANARAFWYSKTYQEEIRPLRLDPSAGDYVVRVYPALPVPPYLADKATGARYLAEFPNKGVEQVEPRP